ncbi:MULTISPECIES: exonuclease domain-containing protein [Agarivorans]|uniref:exonuclease domain-containing protein n=1 Tax=Agarivorans TaxID=261825 RepID=UPI001C7D4F0D|nr:MULTISPECIES: exonuclease domain-containing protein [Agarivorans]
MKWFKHSSQPPMEQLRRSLTPSAVWSKSVQQYMATPLADLSVPISQLEFVALDIETTGLDFSKDKMLSIGTVNFNTESINLATASETFICNQQVVQAKTAEVNGITSNQLDKGQPLDLAIDKLLNTIRGKVVLAHNAVIEKGFLKKYFLERYQLSELPCHYFDTLEIEKKYSFAGRTRLHSSYYLGDLRNHYKLPEYSAHSAAIDALSCAELFIVQIKKLKLEQYGASIKLLKS